MQDKLMYTLLYTQICAN